MSTSTLLDAYCSCCERTPLFESGRVAPVSRLFHARRCPGFPHPPCLYRRAQRLVDGRRTGGESRETTFIHPVFNYSAAFDYVCEELAFPVPHGGDWRCRRHRVWRSRASFSERRCTGPIDDMAGRYAVLAPTSEKMPRPASASTGGQPSIRQATPLRNARSLVTEALRRGATKGVTLPEEDIWT